MKKVENGFFIVFEGCDGSGKTSVSQAVWRKLQSLGFCTEWTREPGGTPSGKVMRELLIKNDSDVSTNAELLLYAADRAQHLDTKIKPALKNGVIVISDRYYQSTMAFQGAGRGHDAFKLCLLQEFAGTVEPDMTFILDAPTYVAQERINKSAALCGVKADEQKFELIAEKDPDFGTRVREAYLNASPCFMPHCADRYPKYEHVNNSGELSVDELANRLVLLVSEALDCCTITYNG